MNAQLCKLKRRHECVPGVVMMAVRDESGVKANLG